MDNPIAVIDSNVFVALYTVADITGSIERQEPREKQYWRLQRQRAALRLAIYFHELEATTLSLHSEPIDKIKELVPPVPDVGTAFMILFVQFVHPHLLSGWRGLGTSRISVKGNKADDALLQIARAHSLPLVTFEGDTPDGIKDQKLREKAKEAGVPVFTPAEFVEGKLAEAVDRFLAGYQEHAPGFSSKWGVFDDPQAHLDGLFETLQRVLNRWPDSSTG